MPCQSRKQIVAIKDALNSVSLPDIQRKSLNNRFLSLLEEYGDRASAYAVSYHSMRAVITIGSLIVPALLSAQFTYGSTDCTASTQIYWIVWSLSLCVTISNALLTLLKVDTKYFILHTTYHHIASEGWLYIELSGKYSGFETPGQGPTHQNQYVYFCHSLEKIRMKQVEEEYYKVDTIHHSPVDEDKLIPPTPMKTTFLSNTEVDGREPSGTTVCLKNKEGKEAGETVATVATVATAITIKETAPNGGKDE